MKLSLDLRIAIAEYLIEHGEKYSKRDGRFSWSGYKGQIRLLDDTVVNAYVELDGAGCISVMVDPEHDYLEHSMSSVIYDSDEQFYRHKPDYIAPADAVFAVRRKLMNAAIAFGGKTSIMLHGAAARKCVQLTQVAEGNSTSEDNLMSEDDLAWENYWNRLLG